MKSPTFEETERDSLQTGDAKTLAAAQDILQGTSTRKGFSRIVPFLGPAFIASVAYMDPGNFATNIQSGAQYGYLLIWVIIASNLMAMLIQTLSAKLGIATGRNLAEMCRDNFPRPVVWGMWGVSEVVAMATDLAEFLGAALGLHLLFNIALFPSAILVGIATFGILGLQRRGFRPLEAVISAFVGVVAVCYLVETFLDNPDWGLILHHSVTPMFDGTDSVMLAVGIIGATVMPHAIFLHSALTQNRIVARDDNQKRKLFKFELADVMIALPLAGLINASMLIMAAATFHTNGYTNIAESEDLVSEAYRTLEPLLGSAASVIFGISLLAAGLSSSAVGTMAGQVIMQGYLHFQIPIWVRRFVTMLPAFVVIWLGVNPTDALVVSQVVLSLGIPFALIPLVIFTMRRDLMGVLTNHKITTIAAWVVATIIVGLNLYFLAATFLV